MSVYDRNLESAKKLTGDTGMAGTTDTKLGLAMSAMLLDWLTSAVDII